MTSLSGNLLVLQGGGPTPVLNVTLYGVLDEARRHGGFGRTLGARFGVEGLLQGDLLDLSAEPTDEIERLKSSPGAALGSTRYKPSESDLERIINRLREYGVRHLLLIGGNGSLRGAEVIGDAAR